jgi:hypothetical protein
MTIAAAGQLLGSTSSKIAWAPDSAAQRPEQQQEQPRRKRAEDETRAAHRRASILPRLAGEGNRASARWRGRAVKVSK